MEGTVILDADHNAQELIIHIDPWAETSFGGRDEIVGVKVDVESVGEDRFKEF